MSDNSSRNIVITGANGFVGSHLCRMFLDEGFRVIAGIRERADLSTIKNLDLDYRYGDITKPETLEAMFDGVDYIIHNAGLVKASKPEIFDEVNRQGTANVVAAAVNSPSLKKLILISSLAAAGPSQKNQVLTEDDPPRPITEYGRSKLGGENEVLNVGDKLNSVIIRPPGVYGPGDEEMFSFFRIIDSRIRPYIGKLKRRLRLVHVDDLALGVVCALKGNTKPGSIYFIAESRSYKFSEMIGILGKASGRWGLPIYMPGFGVRLAGKISESIMRMLGKAPMFTVEKADEILAAWDISTEKAQKDLNFEPKYSFADGALETMHWYRMEAWL